MSTSHSSASVAGPWSKSALAYPLAYPLSNNSPPFCQMNGIPQAGGVAALTGLPLRVCRCHQQPSLLLICPEVGQRVSWLPTEEALGFGVGVLAVGQVGQDVQYLVGRRQRGDF